MFDIGGGELLLIVLAVIVFFGPKKIPEVANMVGKGMRKVRQAQAQFQSQISALEQEVRNTADFDDEKTNQKDGNLKPTNSIDYTSDDNKFSG
ncbi:MAG: hypothetical protein A2X61_06995 [Ignavibacteria bacterium GWB2_35_12]|nr:MAG: hypothetical protein A2X61_06995 [Ignavibacteria bacterium GWB2_35_12]OGU93846.1 MAG: hypothetical protein A2220_11860 [Ignavibacteria bacterium RIFOXYA2_FULL_35_10]OGV22055.1 MAG: hypothetical protein A2475_09495 [Ignavibacteria bacterium RIFOXYC2_FULL_35_21]